MAGKRKTTRKPTSKLSRARTGIKRSRAKTTNRRRAKH